MACNRYRNERELDPSHSNPAKEIRSNGQEQEKRDPKSSHTRKVSQAHSAVDTGITIVVVVVTKSPSLFLSLASTRFRLVDSSL